MRLGVPMTIASSCHRVSARPYFTWSRCSALAFLVVVLVMCGCNDKRDVVFSTDTPAPKDDRPAILADIAALAHAKQIADPNHAAPYHQAVDALIVRGARIEQMLIEALGGNDDWGVRLGVVEVLKAVGTRLSVEPLLGALEDPQPLVALNAERLLREMLKHEVIPAPGAPARNGLPPVPTRPANDLALDADEKLWAAWHREHHATLHRNWRTWWEANRATVKID
jgi:hypothetical protein